MDRRKEEKKLIEKCLRGIAKGKLSFVDELYDVVQAKLFFTAIKYLCDETKAEELLIDFWGNIEYIAKKYQFSKNPMGYLNTVVKNLALMRLRSDKAQAKKEIAVTPKFLEVYKQLTFDYVRDERQQRLEIAFDKGMKLLTEEEETVIYNTFWGKCSLRQCAEEMGISKTTVDRLKKSAIEKLKIILTEDGWDKNDV